MRSEVKFYGVGKNSLKNNLIHLLSVRWPQTVNGLHQVVQKESNMSLTYQAVHKALRELEEDGCLKSENRKFQLNPVWITSMGNALQQIKTNYEVVLQENSPAFSTIIIKDHTLKEKSKELQVSSALKKLIPILKQAFENHNIFEKDEDSVLEYLLKVQEENEILLFSVKGIVSGGVVLIKQEEDAKHKYVRWKLRHFVWKNSLNEKQKLRFIKEIENRLSQEGQKIRIEYNMAETEKDYIAMLEKAGFTKEATWPNRYRYGETAYTYAKFIEKNG